MCTFFFSFFFFFLGGGGGAAEGLKKGVETPDIPIPIMVVERLHRNRKGNGFKSHGYTATTSVAV